MSSTPQQIRYRVRPLSRQLADQVRAGLRSPDYDHPVSAEVATAPAPCRVCLQKFRPGEDRRLLLTYDPFREVVPEWPLPGPIFIHEEGCAPFDGEGLPTTIAGDRLTLTAYGRQRALVAEVRTTDALDASAAVGRLLADPLTQYVHVRSTPNGCFLCHLERVPPR